MIVEPTTPRPGLTPSPKGKDFFDGRVMPVTDCGIGLEVPPFLMPKNLSPEDRLEILRAADAHRKWLSLDDRRICTRCNKFITGRQIEIRRDQRGRFLLHCPTEGCASVAEEWYYAGMPAEGQNGPSRQNDPRDLAGVNAH